MRENKALEVAVPAAVTDLDLLGRVDYEDAYQVVTSVERSPEWWMRAFLEGAPRWFTVPWRVGLGTIALGLHPRMRPQPEHVQGWQILLDGPDAFVVGLDSPRGFKARLVAVTPPGRALLATQIRLDTAYARALWRRIRRGHRFFAPYLVARASRIRSTTSAPQCTLTAPS